MRKILVVSCLCWLILFACKKDTSNSRFSGVYTESSPVAGRTQLNFISNNLLIKTVTGSNYKDSFYYAFSTNKIILTATWNNQNISTSLDFKQIDDTSFQIENLYASIPEAPESFMVFKK